MQYNALTIESRPGNFQAMSRFLEKMNIKALHLQNPEEINNTLNSVYSVSVAIIDIIGYGDTIWDCCKELRKRGIPMLIISQSNNESPMKKYQPGAIVFRKPVLMHELARCIRSLINQE